MKGGTHASLGLSEARGGPAPAISHRRWESMCFQLRHKAWPSSTLLAQSTATDFVRRSFPWPWSVGDTSRVYLFDGLLEDIGTIVAFYEAKPWRLNRSTQAGLFLLRRKISDLHQAAFILPPSKLLTPRSHSRSCGEGSLLPACSHSITGVLGVRSPGRRRGGVERHPGNRCGLLRILEDGAPCARRRRQSPLASAHGNHPSRAAILDKKRPHRPQRHDRLTRTASKEADRQSWLSSTSAKGIVVVGRRTATISRWHGDTRGF